MRRMLSTWWPTVLFFATVGAAVSLSLGNGESTADILINLIVYSAFALTGGWIVSRSRNRIGRLFQALALAAGILFLTEGHLATSLPPGQTGLPDGGLDLAMVWTNNLIFVPFFCLNFVLPFLWFPTGRAASRPWSYVVAAVFAWMLAATAAILVAPKVELPDEIGGAVANPWAVEWLAGPASFLTDHLFAAISLLGLIAVASLIFRYRASGAEQRAQIRWFLLAGVFLILSLILDEVLLDALPIEAPAIEQAIELGVLLIGLLGLPVATAVAVLKYRLYEVDVVINKTLVYLSLTAVLAFCYFGLIVVLQRVLPLSGDSDVAVAASTLAVAALFQPLRARLQAFIDRRFYRRKYDAAETLGRFSGRLRDQVELDALSSELLGAVARTMQPSHVSLWLREGVSR